MSRTESISQRREAFDDQDPTSSNSESCPLAPEISGAKYVIRTATSIEAVEALRPLWRKWAHCLDTDIDYYLHTLTHDSTILRPYVITVYNDGTPRAMLVGKIRKHRPSTVVSFVNIVGPAVRVLEIKKGGRMGQPSPAVDKMLAAELLKATKSGEVDSICLERLSLHSRLFREIQQLRGFLVRERVPHIFCYSVLSLNAPERERLRVFAGKARREIRRKTRILERAFPGQVGLKCFSQLSELDAGMCDAMRVAVTTWQYYLGVGLTDTAQSRDMFRFFAHQGWLRIYVLYVRDVPCAFLVGQLYQSVFYCQYVGYHPNFARYSVGSLLTARAFEDLAAAGVQRVDLGEGGQEHNRRLGCQLCEEGTVHVYSPTTRGQLMNLFFGTAQVVRAGGRRTRSLFGLNWMAKRWSEFLFFRFRSNRPPSNLRERRSL